jgi:diguanylate cyclase (GGDEF)-like protein
MFGISKKTAIKASVAAVLSMIVSVSICLFFVPILGGQPDGPGFWMSLVCPLVIAWPASAWQFHQNERLRTTRNELSAAHAELERVHAELIETHAALQQRSRVDGLTGALNRETFFALLETAAANGSPFALLIADADHFKRINDEFGHQCGDDALRGIAGAISVSLRTSDFWGRIGGEEFAIFLDGANREMAHAIADMIRLATLGINLRVDDKIVPVSVSIGGTCATAGAALHAIVAEADRRLYHAKRSGRNRIVLDDETTESAVA